MSHQDWINFIEREWESLYAKGIARSPRQRPEAGHHADSVPAPKAVRASVPERSGADGR